MAYTISDFRRDMRNGPWAWPGGYPCYFVMSDGEAMSFDAARENCRLILEAIRDEDERGRPYSSGWRVIGVDANWEDEDLRCCHSGERIPSAYGED